MPSIQWHFTCPLNNNAILGGRSEGTYSTCIKWRWGNLTKSTFANKQEYWVSSYSFLHLGHQLTHRSLLIEWSNLSQMKLDLVFQVRHLHTYPVQFPRPLRHSVNLICLKDQFTWADEIEFSLSSILTSSSETCPGQSLSSVVSNMTTF